MANMSYCRFENTLADLEDCNQYIDCLLSADENKARKKLIELCRSIAQKFEDEDLDEYFVNNKEYEEDDEEDPE